MLDRIRKHFARRSAKRRELETFRNSSPKEIFTHIYESNKWGDPESVSGKGSNLSVTTRLRAGLPALLDDLQIRTLLDIPCGDFNWMKEVELNLDSYVGADIVASMIEKNQQRFGNALREFQTLDLLEDALPAMDAILCRECLVHLSFKDISKAVVNMQRSGSKYLLTTHFPEVETNRDIVTGKHHSLNFTRPPFSWPQPLQNLVEYNAGKRRGDKLLSVWLIADLPNN